MSRRREEIPRELGELISKFKEKGAVSPKKAMTTEELGLPPGFNPLGYNETMRHLGWTEIFVEVNGKYYLSEQRLKEVQERISNSRFSKGKLFFLRLFIFKYRKVFPYSIK